MANVSWVIPPFNQSDHPSTTLQAGQNWVAQQINAVMNSQYWSSTAIFITWDEWGGFYDHVVPPVVEALPLIPRNKYGDRNSTRLNLVTFASRRPSSA